ncbi:hypothetical protein GUJ93_ZPchr0007g3987 [Zizania palustris]|uniref:Uncharacterized protein n=1 Tax=Zizania palustris TaxID=103762 RepID=A0A8J5TFD9_ZIZPA|nr:hypothetical protein GUJ93_ZPchr0007g3987 [Zizania palustris]
MYLMSTEKAAILGVKPKASATSSIGAYTQCQKFFQSGHWTYECKNDWGGEEADEINFERKIWKRQEKNSSCSSSNFEDKKWKHKSKQNKSHGRSSTSSASSASDFASDTDSDDKGSRNKSRNCCCYPGPPGYTRVLKPSLNSFEAGRELSRPSTISLLQRLHRSSGRRQRRRDGRILRGAHDRWQVPVNRAGRLISLVADICFTASGQDEEDVRSRGIYQFCLDLTSLGFFHLSGSRLTALWQKPASHVSDPAANF